MQTQNCQYIIKEKIEVVVGHADKGKLLAVICGALTRRKTILYAHGTSFEGRSGLSRLFFIYLDRIESFFSDRIICVSNYLIDLRLKNKIDPLGKAYLPNLGSCGGIDTKNKFNPDLISHKEKQLLKHQYGISQENFVIGFCGRIVRDKGVEELVEAFSIVRKQSCRKVKLLLVGDKDIRDYINEKTVKAIDNDKDIILTGHVSSNIQVYYSIMDLFILPTHRDGFGMCLIEAAAMGIPVLTTNITGSRDAIAPKVNGEYISLNPSKMAESIITLMNNYDLLKYYSGNGRIWAKENFDNKIVWNSLFSCYNSIIQKTNE